MKLHTHESLITPISDEVYNLACFLGIPTNIRHGDDHIYISSALSLESFPIRRTSDVMVSTKVFCEVLMDIKAGLSVRESYKKQGYTFN